MQLFRYPSGPNVSSFLQMIREGSSVQEVLRFLDELEAKAIMDIRHIVE